MAVVTSGSYQPLTHRLLSGLIVQLKVRNPRRWSVVSPLN